MISHLHHVAAVVPTIEEGAEVFRDGLGLEVEAEARVPDQDVRAALLRCGVGEIELLEPLDPAGPIGRFLSRRGGIHHICFETDDVGGELERLAGAGVRLIDTTPRRGVAGSIGFLHPEATLSTLVELATPGDAVETRRFSEPEPPDDVPFRANAITGLVFAVDDPDAAKTVFRTNFGFSISDSLVSLPELGATAVRIELPNVVIDLACPAGGSGPIADRLAAKGPGAAVLALAVESFDPGLSLLEAEGARVRRESDASGTDVALIGGDCVFGIDLELREASTVQD